MFSNKTSFISSAVIISVLSASSHIILADVGYQAKKVKPDTSWMKNQEKTSAQLAAEAKRAEIDAELEAMRKAKQGATTESTAEAASAAAQQKSAGKSGVALGAGATSSGLNPHHFINPNAEKKRFFVPKSGHHMGPKEHSGIQELTKGAAKDQNAPAGETAAQETKGAPQMNTASEEKLKASQERYAAKKDAQAQQGAGKKGVALGAGATSSGLDAHHFVKPDEEKRRFFVPKSGHHMGPEQHSGVQELTKGSGPQKVQASVPAPTEHKIIVEEGQKPQQAVKLLETPKSAKLPTKSSHQKLLDAAKAQAEATRDILKDPNIGAPAPQVSSEGAVAKLQTESSHQKLLDAAKAQAEATRDMVKDPNISAPAPQVSSEGAVAKLQTESSHQKLLDAAKAQETAVKEMTTTASNSPAGSNIPVPPPPPPAPAVKSTKPKQTPMIQKMIDEQAAIDAAAQNMPQSTPPAT